MNIIQAVGIQGTAVDPQAHAYTSSVVAGNRLFAIWVGNLLAYHVAGATDSQGNTWSRLYGDSITPYLGFKDTTGTVSIWTAIAGSSAANTVTFDIDSTPTSSEPSVYLLEVGDFDGYPTIGVIGWNDYTAPTDPIALPPVTTTGEALIISTFRFASAYSSGTTVSNGFTVGINGTRVHLSHRLSGTAVSVTPTLTVGTTEVGAGLTFSIQQTDLPDVGLTGHWDASATAGNFRTTLDASANGSGSVASGDQALYWENRKQRWAHFTPVVGDTGTEDITWENDTVLNLPSLKFSQGRYQGVGRNTYLPPTAKTLLFSFYLDSASTIPDSANAFLNMTLVGESRNAYFGAHVRKTAGVYTLYAYAWDGSEDKVGLTFTPDEPHTVCIRHDGATMYLSMDCGAEVSVASGTTDTGTSFQVGDTGTVAALNAEFRGRIGEIAAYRSCLTGTELTDAKEYFCNKWLLADQIVGSFVAGKDGNVASTLTALFNLDGVQRTVDAEGSLVVGGSLGLIEQASAPTGIANMARIYAEDDGSGKTRLMVVFGTGSAQQLAIEP